MSKPQLIVLIGPTAVGKTELSLLIAERFSCEIVGMDSMQVYRRMDVGTAKPSLAERRQIPHHLIDVVDPDENYSAARFAADASRAIGEIRTRGRIPLLVGGTGLYLRALREGLFDMPHPDEGIRETLRRELKEKGKDALLARLEKCDPLTAARLHPNDSQRLIRALEIFEATGVPWSTHISRHRRSSPFSRLLQIGLEREREELYRRIDQRVQVMVDQGLADETAGLLAAGYGPELKSMQAIGYRHMVHYLLGHWSWEEALRLLARDTRRYAKRQYTWFKRDQDTYWLHPSDQARIIGLIEERGKP